ncbi:hypothetical protein BZA05DRAFT_276365 [Tricharina praecox]|uniref:uncharacterized protein n=1 Tax=Tricharina praecox TaxID=43433 RepID=UPI00221FD52D|nr:uncharacterized protein BZA05DRAFT_276365 [Tricharina praecox]KAI5853985.1 hypothetical protein BZA05DRAFT_276365 [Tricharina praecox]
MEGREEIWGPYGTGNNRRMYGRAIDGRRGAGSCLCNWTRLEPCAGVRVEICLCVPVRRVRREHHGRWRIHVGRKEGGEGRRGEGRGEQYVERDWDWRGCMESLGYLVADPLTPSHSSHPILPFRAFEAAPAFLPDGRKASEKPVYASRQGGKRRLDLAKSKQCASNASTKLKAKYMESQAGSRYQQLCFLSPPSQQRGTMSALVPRGPKFPAEQQAALCWPPTTHARSIPHRDGGRRGGSYQRSHPLLSLLPFFPSLPLPSLPSSPLPFGSQFSRVLCCRGLNCRVIGAVVRRAWHLSGCWWLVAGGRRWRDS